MNPQKPMIVLLLVVAVAAIAASLGPACGSTKRPDPARVEDDAGDSGQKDPERMPGLDARHGASEHPPDFAAHGKTAIFSEITRADATLIIDVAAKTATVKARMEIAIHQPKGGSPVLDVVPATAKFVTVDHGQKVALRVVTSPDGKSTMRMVDAKLLQGKHTLDFDEYALKEGRSDYNNTFIEGIDFTKGFEFLTDQDDLPPRSFTERYFPSGFECDRYPFTVTVKILNATAAQKPDVIAYAKKEVSPDGRSFKISFPANYNTSSWFLHVIDRNTWAFATGEYKSIDGRTIPLSAHADTQTDADLAIADMKVFLPELERDYGPYPHDSLLAAVGGANDPQEYTGALQTDMRATRTTPQRRGSLGHEVLHQWFGRSARPLSGRDGWVDEGIAQWRDDGYPRSTSIKLAGKYVHLAVASPYQRNTPEESYHQGAEVVADLDFLLKDRGGMKPVLKAFYEKFRDKLYTTEDYLDFIRQSAPDLTAQMDPIFLKKVYAGAPAPPMTLR